jgi:hypothetical protein
MARKQDVQGKIWDIPKLFFSGNILKKTVYVGNVSIAWFLLIGVRVIGLVARGWLESMCGVKVSIPD